MANITISSPDDGRWNHLGDRAAGDARPVKEDACLLTCRAAGHTHRRRDLASAIRSHFGPTNGVYLTSPPRDELGLVPLAIA